MIILGFIVFTTVALGLLLWLVGREYRWWTWPLVAVLAFPAAGWAQDVVVRSGAASAPMAPWATTLVTVLLSLGSVLGVVWRLVAPFLQARTVESKAAKTFMVVGELVASLQAEVEMHIRPKWQKAREDGTVTAEEAAAIKAAAVGMFFDLAPIYVKKALGELVGGDEAQRAYIGGLFERANAASKVDSVP